MSRPVVPAKVVGMATEIVVVGQVRVDRMPSRVQRNRRQRRRQIRTRIHRLLRSRCGVRDRPIQSIIKWPIGGRLRASKVGQISLWQSVDKRFEIDVARAVINDPRSRARNPPKQQSFEVLTTLNSERPVNEPYQSCLETLRKPQKALFQHRRPRRAFYLRGRGAPHAATSHGVPKSGSQAFQ